MNIFNQKPVRISQPKKKCKIKIKQHSDGSVTKSVEGECQKSDLEALKEA